MHSTYLKEALKLAEMRRGFCSPNPSVGAVIVKNDQILATGFHWQAGSPHAEIDALSKLGDEARGASLYVTLEPCCHFGRTPPCTESIIARGIARVIYGSEDPNPLMCGKGRQRLTDAGILCVQHPLSEIERFYESYRHWRKTGMPFVTAKIALSLDGKIAGENGEPVLLTKEKARELTHQMRKRSDAILTTSKTILHDNPQLNARLANGDVLRKPLFVLDSLCRTPRDARIFSSASEVTLFHNALAPKERTEFFEAKGAACALVSHSEKGLCLDEVLKAISKKGFHDVWVEAGGRCFEALLRSHLIQRTFVYLAPCWLGSNAYGAFPDDFNPFEGAKKIEWQALGQDALCVVDFT